MGGFTAFIVGSMDNRSPLAAHLDATTITMGLPGGAGNFATAPFPAMDLLVGKPTPFTIYAKCNIVSQDAFDHFSKTLLSAKNVSVQMQADANVHAMGLSFGVSLNKTVVLEGM